jgi:hypothetical protein
MRPFTELKEPKVKGVEKVVVPQEVMKEFGDILKPTPKIRKWDPHALVPASLVEMGAYGTQKTPRKVPKMPEVEIPSPPKSKELSSRLTQFDKMLSSSRVDFGIREKRGKKFDEKTRSLITDVLKEDIFEKVMPTETTAKAKKQKVKPVIIEGRIPRTKQPRVPSIPRHPKPPKIPILPQIKMPPLFEMPSRKRGGKTGVQPKKYMPSLSALLFNIKGKQPKGVLTGLELRPIPSSFPKRRRSYEVKSMPKKKRK